MTPAGRPAEVHRHDVAVAEGRVVTVHDPDPGHDEALPLVWHHGSLHHGRPPAPLLPVARRLGFRMLGVDRPGYGGSGAHTGRSVGSVGEDVVAVADALGLSRYAVVGYSGGGSHALATAARDPDRVAGVVALAPFAPRDAAGLDWYADLGGPLTASFRAAEQGREAKLRHERQRTQAPPAFTDADAEALAGPWSWYERARADAEVSVEARADDHLALVSPWGFEPAEVGCPVLLVHGERDPAVPSTHSRWLAGMLLRADVWVSPDDGHVSVLRRGEAALEWLARTVR